MVILYISFYFHFFPNLSVPKFHIHAMTFYLMNHIELYFVFKPLTCFRSLPLVQQCSHECAICPPHSI